MPVKLILICGGAVSITGFLISSFITNFTLFIIFYGCIGALGCGVCYMAALVVSWEHFPERKGLVTGVIDGGYGLGSLAYVQIARAVVNPDNLEATIDSGQKDLKYFDDRVAKNVPLMLRILSLIWAIQILVAVVLITRKETEESDEKSKETWQVDIPQSNPDV